MQIVILRFLIQKILKRKGIILQIITKCLNSVKNIKQTNPKLKSFNQIYYHAGLYNDIEKYVCFHFKFYLTNLFQKEKAKIETIMNYPNYSHQLIWFN